MKRTFLLLLLIPALAAFIHAQIPAGYYDNAAGKTGENLQSALHNIIKGHTIVSYTPGVWNAFYTTDVKPNGTVWDMYSDIPNGTPNGNPPYVYQMGSDQCSTESVTGENICYSREHSWPKSWFGDIAPMNTDLFHIYPTDQYVNNRRSDNPYGEVGNATWTSENGSMLGDCITTGYSGTVFEPLDDYKGDFARSYFYMSTRYYTEDTGWPGSDMTSGATVRPWALNMLLHWSRTDPVSEKETNRNEAVYLIQHNRNPFIDHPEYANLIWGNPIGIGESENPVLHIYPNPATENCTLQLPKGRSLSNLDLTLISMAGTTLKPVYAVTDNKILVNLEGTATGVYFILLTNQDHSFTCHAKLMRN
jgi:endonuclease I